jgi:hypothetical protein
MNKTIWTGVLASALAVASVPAFAQTAGQDIKDAGHATKVAGKDTGKGVAKGTKVAGHDTKVAAEDTGKDVKKGTKAGYHKTKSGTKKAYHKTGSGIAKVGDKMEGKPKPQ